MRRDQIDAVLDEAINVPISHIINMLPPSDSAEIADEDDIAVEFAARQQQPLTIREPVEIHYQP
jgi:hypothetical protein